MAQKEFKFVGQTMEKVTIYFGSFLTGWAILLLFWSTIVFFIYLRKPPKSKLTKGFVIKSYLFFLIILFAILFFR